jgi:Metal-dependent amidase/aminoacylase/carboxypeptidase
MMNETNNDLNQLIEQLAEEVFPLSEYLTAHPELGGEEKMSSAYIAHFLKVRGYTVEMNYCQLPYAFRAYKPSDKPRIAVMCEYDALPEIGHGCGHSLSCGISILAALAVINCFQDFPFEIDMIGTPGEETIGGKVILAQRGGFDCYQYAIMGHIDSINATQIRVLACNDMYITLKGLAAHASTAPWKGESALNAAQLFMHGIDLQRVHYKPFMQMHGIVVEGGTAPNTIPDKVVLDYYPRAATMGDLNTLNKNAQRLLKGIAYATNTEYTVKQRYDTFAELHYGKTAVHTLKNIFKELDMEVEEMEFPEGSTDAGNVDLVIPTFHLEIKGTDTPVSFHTKEFEQLMYGDRARKTLRDGAKVIANFIWQTAYKEGLLETITQEWKFYRDAQKS